MSEKLSQGKHFTNGQVYFGTHFRPEPICSTAQIASWKRHFQTEACFVNRHKRAPGSHFVRVLRMCTSGTLDRSKIRKSDTFVFRHKVKFLRRTSKQGTCEKWNLLRTCCKRELETSRTRNRLCNFHRHKSETFRLEYACACATSACRSPRFYHERTKLE